MHHVCLLRCFSHAWLFVTVWTVAPPGCSVHGILQARILEWIAMLSSRESFLLRDQNCVTYISWAGRQVWWPCDLHHMWTLYFRQMTSFASDSVFLSSFRQKCSQEVSLFLLRFWMRKHEQVDSRLLTQTWKGRKIMICFCNALWCEMFTLAKLTTNQNCYKK